MESVNPEFAQSASKNECRRTVNIFPPCLWLALGRWPFGYGMGQILQDLSLLPQSPDSCPFTGPKGCDVAYPRLVDAPQTKLPSRLPLAATSPEWLNGFLNSLLQQYSLSDLSYKSSDSLQFVRIRSFSMSMELSLLFIGFRIEIWVLKALAVFN